MTDPLLSGDHETVHLFSVALPEDDLWAFITPDPDTGAYPLRDALGVALLDEAQVEGAVAEDLDGIGLTGFLTEGIGVDETQIAAHRARIDALSGAVVIVKGAAFDGARVPLAPMPPLTHVGSWHLTPAPSTMEPLTAAAAEGMLPPPPPAPPGPRNRMTLWLLIGVAAVLILGLALGALA